MSLHHRRSRALLITLALGATVLAAPAAQAAVIDSNVVVAPVAATVDEGTRIDVTADYTGVAVPLTAVFVWNDGAARSTIAPQGSGPWTASASYVYLDQGTYEVKARFDTAGTVFRGSATYTVLNVSPQIVPVDDARSGIDLPFDLVLDVSDPGDDVVTITVDWGDGSVPDVVVESTRITGFSHTYSTLGSVIVSVTAADEDGGVSLETFALGVVPTCRGLAATIDVAALGLAPGDTVIGTKGADVIVDTDDPHRIIGRAGDDVICAAGGADSVFGGPGDDVIDGGFGSDEVRAGDGDDVIFGGPGGDTRLNGGSGDDTIFGGDGPDLLRGSGGEDTLDGEGGADTVLGGGGADILLGGASADLIVGGPGAAWTSETQRARAYTGFVHFYNHHRSHGALGWATPTSILKDNLPAMHT